MFHSQINAEVMVSATITMDPGTANMLAGIIGSNIVFSDHSTVTEELTNLYNLLDQMGDRGYYGNC